MFEIMCDVCFFFDFQTSKNVWESCWKCAISCVHFTKKKIYQDKIRTTELKLRRTTKVSNRSWTGEKEKAWVEESVKKFCLVTLSLFLLALDYVVYYEHVSALPALATVAPVSHQRHLQCFGLTAAPTSTAPLIHHYSSIHTVNVHSGSNTFTLFCSYISDKCLFVPPQDLLLSVPWVQSWFGLSCFLFSWIWLQSLRVEFTRLMKVLVADSVRSCLCFV